MSYIIRTIIIGFMLFITEGGVAQSRFKASAFAGVNLSQIDGDRQEGYRKPGVSLGINGSIFLRHDLDISTELMYNRKGAKPSKNRPVEQIANYSNFSLNYSEVALILKYYYGVNSTKSYFTRSVFAGLSYGRLVKSSTSLIKNNLSNSVLETSITSKYNPHDFSFLVGWSQLITPKLGFSLRFTRSINFLYQNPNYTYPSLDGNFDYLKPYFLSFHLFYNFISPSKIMDFKPKKKKGTKNDPLEELY